MDELLRTLVLVFLAAGIVLHLFHRLGLPSVVGLLLAGVALGPHGAGVVEDPTQIERLADIGVLLLMFSIGLDFTPDRLRELGRMAGPGVLQMAICVAGTTAAAAPFVDDWGHAVFLGFLVAHTSSTLMMKLLMDRGEAGSPHMRVGLGISITQDLSVVPMLLLVPMLAGGGLAWSAFAADVGRALLVAVAVLVLARWIVPLWLHEVVQTRSRELFLIFVVVVAVGTAWATTAVGLSLALGAFLAGLAIAESDYRHQTFAEIAPFRDLLVSLFFISVGMLFDPRTLVDYAGPALATVAGVVLLKAVSGFVPAALWGYPLSTSTLVGLSMAQVGEFAFVLARVGASEGLIDGAAYQVFLLVVVASMTINPALMASASAVTTALRRVPGLRRLHERVATDLGDVPPLENHVVIAGFGLNGRNMLHALQALDVPCVVVDMNPASVRQATADGLPVYFGDCTRADVLRRLRIDTARVYVAAISDAQATRQSVQVARREHPGLHIIARTKYLAEIEVLHRLGANQVISEEFETSLEVLTHTLASYQLPRTRIDEVITRFRDNAYQALRAGEPAAAPGVLGEMLPQLDIEPVIVAAGSPADGRSLGDLDLRARTGATLIAIRRHGTLLPMPGAGMLVHAGDVLLITGRPPEIGAAIRLLAPPPVAPDPA